MTAVTFVNDDASGEFVVDEEVICMRCRLRCYGRRRCGVVGDDSASQLAIAKVSHQTRHLRSFRGLCDEVQVVQKGRSLRRTAHLSSSLTQVLVLLLRLLLWHLLGLGL